MLCELMIENLALFERASLSFGTGLNVVSGETGAGKSLLVGALEFLLGARSKAAQVRKGAGEARVEGRFTLAPGLAGAAELRAVVGAELPELLEEWDAQGADEERELILSRRLAGGGGSRAYVNHRPVTQRALKELAALLVEIHGQNEHQRLLSPTEQLALLDEFGGLERELGGYRAARARWQQLVARRLSFEAEARERRDRIDLLRFQREELAGLALEPGEVEALEEERVLLRHASALTGELGQLARELSDEDGAALETLRRLAGVLERWEARVPALGAVAEDLRGGLAGVEEASLGLARFLSSVEHRPGRLEEVEDRLFRIEELARKHHVGAADLVQRRDALAAELAGLLAGDVGLEELVRECQGAQAEVEAIAARLSRARKAACKKLALAVAASLAELGLERARFEVALAPRRAEPVTSPNADPARAALAAELERLGPAGAERAEFLLCANPGESLQPLREVASGGEAARIMLALRTALAVRQTIPTLVFDEIDAGVGGRLGPRVAQHLRRLAAHHQVLCVTHLPAIAARAEHHFKVEKERVGSRTRTQVRPLSGAEREAEVADMIAGGAAHESARAEARRLLDEA